MAILKNEPISEKAKTIVHGSRALVMLFIATCVSVCIVNKLTLLSFSLHHQTVLRHSSYSVVPSHLLSPKTASIVPVLLSLSLILFLNYNTVPRGRGVTVLWY